MTTRPNRNTFTIRSRFVGQDDEFIDTTIHTDMESAFHVLVYRTLAVLPEGTDLHDVSVNVFCAGPWNCPDFMASTLGIEFERCQENGTCLYKDGPRPFFTAEEPAETDADWTAFLAAHHEADREAEEWDDVHHYAHHH